MEGLLEDNSDSHRNSNAWTKKKLQQELDRAYKDTKSERGLSVPATTTLPERTRRAIVADKSAQTKTAARVEAETSARAAVAFAAGLQASRQLHEDGPTTPAPLLFNFDATGCDVEQRDNSKAGFIVKQKWSATPADDASRKRPVASITTKTTRGLRIKWIPFHNAEGAMAFSVLVLEDKGMAADDFVFVPLNGIGQTTTATSVLYLCLVKSRAGNEQDVGVLLGRGRRGGQGHAGGAVRRRHSLPAVVLCYGEHEQLYGLTEGVRAHLASAITEVRCAGARTCALCNGARCAAVRRSQRRTRAARLWSRVRTSATGACTQFRVRPLHVCHPRACVAYAGSAP